MWLLYNDERIRPPFVTVVAEVADSGFGDFCDDCF